MQTLEESTATDYIAYMSSVSANNTNGPRLVLRAPYFRCSFRQFSGFPTTYSIWRLGRNLANIKNLFIAISKQITFLN